MHKFLIILTFFFTSYNCEQKLIQNNIEIKKNQSVLQPFPEQIDYISDYENILNEEQKKDLNHILDNFNKKTNIQIAILSITSIEPYNDIHQYSVDLGNNWNLNPKSIVIAFSKEKRSVAIATSTIIEKTLSDSLCQSVIDNDMIPEFKKENYYNGLKNGILSIINKLN